MSVVIDNLETIKTSFMILKKNPLGQIPYEKLAVLYLNNEGTLKVVSPQLQGTDIIERTIQFVSPQMEEMQQSKCRSSFENITKDFSWDQITDANVTDDLFVVVVDSATREVFQMTQLTDFGTDCMTYFKNHSDSEDCSYEKPQKRYGRG